MSKARPFCFTMLGKLLLVLLVAAPGVLAQTQNIDTLRTIAQQNPSVEAWTNLGSAYLEANRLDEAKDAFLEAIALDYRSGDAHFGLGLTEYNGGDYEAARFAFSEVTRLFPERFDGHFNLGVTLARLREFDGAATAFREAIAQAEPEASEADRVGAYTGLAGQLKRLDNYGEAAMAYGAALELRPQDAELAYLRADALYRAGQGLEALPELAELEASTSDYRVSALISRVYVDQGQNDYALRSLERALRKAEGAGDVGAQAQILVQLGLLQRDLGREAEAANAFSRASSLNPNNWEALYYLGASYLAEGQTRSALDVLERAVQLEGNSAELNLALASAYDQLAQASNALAAAERANDQLEDPALASQANFIVGRSLYRLGDYEGARSVLDEVVIQQPSNADAQLWAGLAAYQQTDYDAAVQFYERAVQLDPENIEARVNLGAAYLVSERYQDAELVYELLTEESPNDAESFYNLGWALLSQNRREPAKEAWERALELGYQPAQSALTEYF